MITVYRIKKPVSIASSTIHCPRKRSTSHGIVASTVHRVIDTMSPTTSLI